MGTVAPTVSCDLCGRGGFKNQAGVNIHKYYAHKRPEKLAKKALKKLERMKVKHESKLQEQQDGPQVVWLSGYLSAIIENFCRGHDLPADAVTRRVGELLLAQTRR